MKKDESPAEMGIQRHDLVVHFSSDEEEDENEDPSLPITTGAGAATGGCLHASLRPCPSSLLVPHMDRDSAFVHSFSSQIPLQDGWVAPVTRIAVAV